MNTEYKIGALSKALKITKKDRRVDDQQSTEGLKDMFTVTKKRGPLYVQYKSVKAESFVKRKRQIDGEGHDADDDDDGEIQGNTVSLKKRKKRWPGKLKLEEMEKNKLEGERRTVFVGNLSNKIDRKKIAKAFKECGEIETVRIRSVALADPGMPRKVGTITRDFHPKRGNMNAYIRFKSVEEAKAALKLNGSVIDKFHIRVDMADENARQPHHNKRSIFLGNLPFDIDEEAVFTHFEDCGDIDNVRLIRDVKTGIGKGFGYVTFKTTDPVELALRLDGTDLDGRELRVSRAVQNPNKKINASKVKLKKKQAAKTAKKAMKKSLIANSSRTKNVKLNIKKTNVKKYSNKKKTKQGRPQK